MAKYGFPYQGSKNSIAKDIIDFLPRGKRFVDLFAGGGAVSHYAGLSKKYKKVLYSELNPLACNLFENAISGLYNVETFIPEFITREKFHKFKDIDGYIKYIWSFGNNGKTYLFGKGIEEFKKNAHNFIVFKDKESLVYLENHFKDSYFWHIKNLAENGKNYLDRRLLFTRLITKIEAIRVTKLYSDKVFNEFKDLSFEEFMRLSHQPIIKSINKYIPDIPKKDWKKSRQEELRQLQQLERLEQLEHVQQLERLQQLQQLQRLEHLEQLQHLQQLQQLERLEQLQQLQRLEQLKQLEQNNYIQVQNKTYLDYKYQEGDVVYCDPPYEGTGNYDGKDFNHKEFYNWVYNSNFPVYFSSYKISDNRFHIVWEKEKASRFNNTGKKSYNTEKIYSNRIKNSNTPLKFFLS